MNHTLWFQIRIKLRSQKTARKKPLDGAKMYNQNGSLLALVNLAVNANSSRMSEREMLPDQLVRLEPKNKQKGRDANSCICSGASNSIEAVRSAAGVSACQQLKMAFTAGT